MKHLRRAAQHGDGCCGSDHNADNAPAAVCFCILPRQKERFFQNSRLPRLRQCIDRQIRQLRRLKNRINVIHMQILPGITRF